MSKLDTGGSVIETHRFKVFADYHQFYLWDSGAAPQAPTDFDDGDVSRRVKVGPNVVVIQPFRNMDVPVELQLFGEEPAVNLAPWDHVAECSVDLPSGQLQVHESTGGSVLDLNVPPGAYRVRVCFGGFDTLGGDLEGDDHYTLQVWPSGRRELVVLKQWEPPV